MTRRRIFVIFAAVVLIVAAAFAVWAINRHEDVSGASDAGRPAKIYPDYAGVTVPPNIAPLNFHIQEPAGKYQVVISGDPDSGSDRQIQINSGDGNIRIPAKAWHELLLKQQGNSVWVVVYARLDQGWKRFSRFQIQVATEPIDAYAIYRLIPPIFSLWQDMAIYQRNLQNFDQRVVLHNERSADASGKNAAMGCTNCHTPLNNKTDKMLLQVRPAKSSSWQPGMILVQNGKAQRVETRAGKQKPASYISWHPSGELLAFSRNALNQFCHADNPESREVVDNDSDLGLYVISTGKILSDPKISQPGRLETFPTWAPDGKWLYFASTIAWNPDKGVHTERAVHVRYDLMRVGFDLAKMQFGRLETVVSAQQLGKSISLPRISPDGRFLMFCAHDYGSFPIYQNDSDLYMVDLAKLASQEPPTAVSNPTDATQASQPAPLAVGEAAPVRLTLNSDRSDSYHSWSSNSRWVIFSSKREDGIFARPYICHIDEQGRCGKPFLMPQEDPTFYSRFLMTYNLPDLITEPVKVTDTELVNAINSPPINTPSTMPVTTPSATYEEPKPGTTPF